MLVESLWEASEGGHGHRKKNGDVPGEGKGEECSGGKEVRIRSMSYFYLPPSMLHSLFVV